MEKDIFLNPTHQTRQAIRERLEGYSAVERLVLGRSILGEDIDLYKIGRGARRLLYVGAHHGSEHITASLLYYFLEKISQGETVYGANREKYFDKYTLFILPMLNPDGIELAIRGEYDNILRGRQMKMAGEEGFSHWQANARGVDLNHNYSVGFYQYKRIEAEREIVPGKTLYSGEYPESEPESQALASLARTLDFSLSVSLHSQGEEIYFFPRANGNGSLSNEERVGKTEEKNAPERALSAAAFLAGELDYRLSEPEGTAAYGGFSDYAAGELGIPSLTLEVGRGENPLPEGEYYRIRDRIARALALLPENVL